MRPHPANGQTAAIVRFTIPPERYAIIDLRALSGLNGFVEVADFQQAHRQWVAEAITRGIAVLAIVPKSEAAIWLEHFGKLG